MAIFSLRARMVSRGRREGNSSVGKSAYNGGRKLYDSRQGKIFNFEKKLKEVVHSIIIAPEPSPDWAHCAEKLWNEVEKKELRKDSQTARELIIVFPVELNLGQQIKLIESYITKIFIKEGMIADINIHHPQKNQNAQENPHAHVLLTTRKFDRSLSGRFDFISSKERSWNKIDKLLEWRKAWEEACNEALKNCGINSSISSESYETRKIPKIPTLHIGNDKNCHIKKEINQLILEVNKLIDRKNNKNSFFQQNHLTNDLEKLIFKIESTLSQKRLKSYKKITELTKAVHKTHQLMLDKNKCQRDIDEKETSLTVSPPPKG